MSPEDAQKLQTQQYVVAKIDGRFRIASIFKLDFPMFHLSRLSCGTPMIDEPIHHDELQLVKSFTDVADLLVLLAELVAYHPFTMENL